jgi:hypothetical protein
MANALYQEQMEKQNQQGGIFQLMKDLKQLKSSGINPNEKIQQMLNSGQVTQQQYNEAVQKAQQIQQIRNLFGM